MIGPLDTAGSVAIENARVYKELRRGRIEPSLASRVLFARCPRRSSRHKHELCFS